MSTTQIAFTTLAVIAGLLDVDVALLWIGCIVAEFRRTSYDGMKLLAWTMGAVATNVAVVVTAGFVR